jgi:predicted protein tyrosine phosphatase
MLAPWIENISLADVRSGYHYDPGPNAMLIQIVDPGVEFPKPKHKEWRRIRQFFFLDVEDNEPDGALYSCAITNEDAKGIAEALREAWEGNMNVVVHCHMGVARSGAVAEVGTMMGFRDVGKFRIPNLMVKKKLMEQLGMI